MTYTDRILATITDDRERQLTATVFSTGSAVDAASDGSYHHVYPAATADAMVALINCQYRDAVRALSDYRHTVGRVAVGA